MPKTKSHVASSRSNGAKIKRINILPKFIEKETQTVDFGASNYLTNIHKNLNFNNVSDLLSIFILGRLII